MINNLKLAKPMAGGDTIFDGVFTRGFRRLHSHFPVSTGPSQDNRTVAGRKFTSDHVLERICEQRLRYLVWASGASVSSEGEDYLPLPQWISSQDSTTLAWRFRFIVYKPTSISCFGSHVNKACKARMGHDFR